MPNVANGPSYQQGYMSSFDNEHRILDIRNRNPMSPVINPFGTNNAKVDNYNDISIHSNRISVFGQRMHSDPKYSRPNGGPSFQNPFTGINHLNFGSNLDNNLHSYKALTVHNRPFEVFSRPIFVYNGVSKNRSPADFGFWNDHDTTKHRTTNHLEHRHQEFLNNIYKSQGIVTRPKQNELVTGNYDFRKLSSRPTISNSYGFETNGARISNGGFKDTSELWNPGLAFRSFDSEKPKCEYFNSISLM